MEGLVYERATDQTLGYSASKYLVSPLLALKIYQIVNRWYSQQERSDYKTSHDRHFSGQTAVCSSIIYCRCNKHDTMAVLFVKADHSDRYVLPGGRRDKAGEGRAKYSKQDESCWQAIQGEFYEEVGEHLTAFCPQPCPFFTTTVQRGYTKGSYSSARNIRTYFFETQCERIPDQVFGRFRLYETTARKWVSLEDIVCQFRFTYYNNRNSMNISPTMFHTFKHFSNIVINQLRLQGVTDVDLQVRVFKTIRMLEQISNSEQKTKLPQQIPFKMEDAQQCIVITDFLLQ